MEQMKQNKEAAALARQQEIGEQKKRITEAHLSLDRDRVERQRVRENYVQELNYYGGQKQEAIKNQQYRMKMEMTNDLNNIEMYVRKEQMNEQEYRNRFDVANMRMNKNQSNLLGTLKNNTLQRRSEIANAGDVNWKSIAQQRASSVRSQPQLESVAQPNVTAEHDPYANDFLAQQLKSFDTKKSRAND